VRRSLLDFGPRARVVFALLFFAAELALITTSSLRPDQVFGFAMFNGSSEITITLTRRVRDRRGRNVEAPMLGGVWQARDRGGQVHTFRFGDFVRGTRLTRLDRRTHAKDGVDAQIFHLQLALDHVAAAIEDDAETLALVAHVHGVINGHTKVEATLEGRRP